MYDLECLPFSLKCVALGVESIGNHCPALRSVRVKHQPSPLSSVLCLLDVSGLLELRLGEANLLDDMSMCGNHNSEPLDENSSKNRLSEVDHKTGEDPFNQTYTNADEERSKRTEDKREELKMIENGETKEIVEDAFRNVLGNDKEQLHEHKNQPITSTVRYLKLKNCPRASDKGFDILVRPHPRSVV